MSETPKPDLLDNLIRRTDNDFHGVEDDSLIGHDLPEDEDEEEDEIGGEASRDPKSV